MDELALCVGCGALKAGVATACVVCAGEPACLAHLPGYAPSYLSTAHLPAGHLSELSLAHMELAQPTATARGPVPAELRPWVFLRVHVPALAHLPPPATHAARVDALADELDAGLPPPARARRFVRDLARAPRLRPAELPVGGQRHGSDGCLLICGLLWLGAVVTLHTVVHAWLVRWFRISGWSELSLGIGAYVLLAAPAWAALLSWAGDPWLTVSPRWVRWRDALGRRGRIATEDLLAATVTVESSQPVGEGGPLERYRVALEARTGDAELVVPALDWLDPLVRLVPPERRCLPGDAEL